MRLNSSLMNMIMVEVIIMKTINITVSDDTHQRAKALAVANRTTLKQFYLDAIEAPRRADRGDDPALLEGGEAVSYITQKPATRPRRVPSAAQRSPRRSIIGEVLGPEGLCEVLSCCHIQGGVYDPVTGMPTADQRGCVRCLQHDELTPLEAFVQELGGVEDPIAFPLDPSWQVMFQLHRCRCGGWQ